MVDFMQAKKDPRGMSIRYVKGVGPAKAALFEKLGVRTVSDIFYFLPRRYEDRTNVVEASEARAGTRQAVKGRVLKCSLFRARTGTGIFELTIGNDSGRVFGVWYNQPFLSKVFSVGQEVVLYGEVELSGRLQITHPAFEINSPDKNEESLEIGRIVPFYPLTENLSQREVRRAAFRAVKAYSFSAEDPLPTRIRARKQLVDLKFAIENIHFPHSFENLDKSYRRLVFEEFFMLQVVMALRRKKTVKKGVAHSLKDGVFEEFENILPFELTPGQKKCISEIEQDMSGVKPMYRLLQGDVGSGKTAVAIFALLLTCRNGHQGVIMAPTEILARQHYMTISKVLMPLGLNVRLLAGGMELSDREKVKKEILQGDADVVIGTHSVIQRSVEFKDLALVVIDEQHKFGVEQRKQLMKKGARPDTLVMTATPIPRSLVLTVFGDMDISTLKEKPLGRRKVLTYWTSADDRSSVYGLIRSEVASGRQAFIVYPRIKEGAEGISTGSTEEMYKILKKDVFPDLKVAMLHGKMGTSDKEKVMKDFVAGKYDILAATTMVEVGVDVPNVSVMLVEHAEMYGLSQLHQLRGRIGRGKHASYCVLISGDDSESSGERMEAMTSMDDGFLIAEKDLDIRGPGEFLGTRQSGLPELKFGNIAKDFSVMEEARHDAFMLVEEDPELKDERNRGVKDRINEMFKGKVKLL
jgi:ATP-dependent DNA helicase RecG